MTKPPYAIAMKDGVQFGIAGLRENWREQATGRDVRPDHPLMPTRWCGRHPSDLAAGRLCAMAGRGARSARPN
jgi:hypothetical protein